ncbi:MAG: helix-turn-helix transcriptional regulator [Reichenbachiella sp.]|uniref:PadR family transcriptional regulator n=1 Tax=Reichenbachiella sp. TaxID=2184521 RepID=UPI0029672E03|nr:helix-turn-helix transcriptional regulator [Reichenbachiella sp.]MDW3211412.1 helix-turn-helix transcriptional regulator [Reichenbachiella sp.]
MKYALGEFEEIVLLLVAAQHDEAYGLSITKAIEEKLERSVTLSSVHTALYRLEEKGYVQSQIGGSSTARGGRRKRLFTITATGKSALQESRASRNLLWDMISNVVIE